MKHEITFIGELPPPFNGVSVKDKLMYEHIFGGCDTQMIDLVECKRSPLKIPLIFLQIVMAMVKSKAIVIGVGSTFRRKFLLVLQQILTGRKGLEKVMMIVMGGQFHHQVANDKCLRKLLYHVGSIWVESEKMIEGLKSQGITHVYLFPNCRTEDGNREPILRSGENSIRLVYFAGINIEKGVEYIFKAIDILENICKVELDFYGELGKNIQDQFLKFIQSHNNVRYCGVYNATEGRVYELLNKYDIMIRPTQWAGEGVAGALVEAKMAGITAIVSDCGFNSEVVRNGEEGIVISQPLAENLANTINLLGSDRDLLMKLKNGAYESRKRYCISTYKNKIIEYALKQTV